MPSILTHPAVPLAIAAAYGQCYVSRHLLLVAVGASVLPDLDSLGFRLGIPYGDLLGHRGLSHSILFALLLAVGAAMLYRTLQASPSAAFAVVLISCASHGLLDALTSGGWESPSSVRSRTIATSFPGGPLRYHRSMLSSSFLSGGLASFAPRPSASGSPAHCWAAWATSFAGSLRPTRRVERVGGSRCTPRLVERRRLPPVPHA